MPGVVNQLAAPLRLEALEIVLAPTPSITQTTGTLDVRAVEASDAASGDGWTPVAFDPGQPGWSWQRSDRTGQSTYSPPSGRPARIAIDKGDPIQAFFQDSSATFRVSAATTADFVVNAIASASFLAATGDQVGDTISGAIAGNPIRFQIVQESGGLPPLDPTRPFLVVDGPSLSLADYFGRGGIVAPSEWWLAVQPGSAAALGRTLASPPFSATTIISRDALLAQLQGDPVGLGVVGALLLGAIAATLFAALGFLVSASASIESRADDFGLLRALGLTDGQLLRWLAVEQGLLLAIGVAVGIGLGVAFAWVILPAVNFTAEREPGRCPRPPWSCPGQVLAGDRGSARSGCSSPR